MLVTLEPSTTRYGLIILFLVVGKVLMGKKLSMCIQRAYTHFLSTRIDGENIKY